MSQKNKQELYNLSSQMIDLFIKDVFAKNDVDFNESKTKITEEQRESLQHSANHLKKQVEHFIENKNASQTITENEENNSHVSTSPLREKMMKKEEANEADDQEETQEE